MGAERAPPQGDDEGRCTLAQQRVTTHQPETRTREKTWNLHARIAENTPLTAFLIALAVLTLAPAAHAGLNDPIPSPFTKHVFSVPGIINDGLATVVSCSNATSASLNVGVEWFRRDGTSLGVGSTTVPAGETRNFGSAGVLSLPIDAQAPTSATVKSGAARVLSTSTKGLLCNAFVIDPANDPPTRMMQLLVTAPLKQKGQ